jgi:hypothetical protein
MRRLLALAMGTCLLMGVAHAGTPFGGDDTGFAPPDKAALVCAGKVLLLGSKTAVKIMQCHDDLAADALAGQGIGNSEEACENAATSKLDGQLSKLFAQHNCAACLATTTATLGADLEAAGDADLGDKFCSGTTSFAAIGQTDDTGFVPPDGVTYKCEAAVAKNLARLNYCIAKCHVKMAKYAIRGVPFDDEACESTDPRRSCRAKYNKVRDKLASLPCPVCVNSAMQDQLADEVEANADAGLGAFYCASPSGAFLE